MAMNLNGEYRIPAPAATVWQALNDPAVLQNCIAGCKTLEKISDTEFAATVAMKVGPVSATFRGSVVLSELDPPRGYTLTGRGQGGAAGFAKMSARVELAESGTDTLLKYVANAEVGGKLASVGSRLVQAVAKKNADDFFSTFAGNLGGEARRSSGPSVPATVNVHSTATSTTDIAVVRAVGRLRYRVPAWILAAACGASIAFGYVLGRIA